jgi:GTP-binding protein
MTVKIPSVAIVGRTNVGKSSLFNALVGKKVALVQNAPGVTRDRSYALVTRYGDPFTLIDTGGMVGEDEGDLQAEVRHQCELALEESDLVIAVLDGMHGTHALDYEVVDFLRQTGKPVLWVANKCEKDESESTAADLYSLGIDEIHHISAAHHQGLDELVELIQKNLGLAALGPEEDEETFKPASNENSIRVAVVGRPNAGKSSLVNKILGQDRLITSPIAGTTRDPIDVTLSQNGTDYVFVDTAGLRKKTKVDYASLEYQSTMRTLRVLARCDVAVLVVDATLGPPSEQDQKIVGLIHERGRGLVIVVNKWDAVEKDHKTVKDFERAVHEQLKFATYAPIVFVSALTGRRCPAVLDKVKEVFEARRVRMKTSELNQVLNRAFALNAPPAYHGEPIRMYFATQVACEPPTFILFVNHPKRINFSYLRYIKNVIRDHTPFTGVDIRLNLRKRISKDTRSRSPQENEAEEPQLLDGSDDE